MLPINFLLSVQIFRHRVPQRIPLCSVSEVNLCLDRSNDPFDWFSKPSFKPNLIYQRRDPVDMSKS